MFLEGWGVAFTLTALVLVACIVLHDRPSALTRLLSRPSLTWLGRASLVIYVWHYPLIFWSVATPTWSWVPQTIVFLAMLAAIVLAADRWVERPCGLAPHPLGHRTRIPPTPNGEGPGTGVTAQVANHRSARGSRT